MNLKAKQGGNQKGLCFVPADISDLDNCVCEIRNNSERVLADIKRSTKVPEGLIYLDSRVFSSLHCEDESEVSVSPLELDIPVCKTLVLAVQSKKGLNNRLVSEAISKRINDLVDDFEGLILQQNQTYFVPHLGIQFSVRSLEPKNGDNRSCRVKWDKLTKIQLVPVSGSPSYNIVCIVEIGAAINIEDVSHLTPEGETKTISRYSSACSILHHIMSHYTGFGSDTRFSGLIYSDEVLTYPIFDIHTGVLSEIVSLYSKSVLEAYIEWIEEMAPLHREKPSNPGAALAAGIKLATDIADESDYPTIVILCSSGVHSAGPNPVKVVKKSQGLRKIPIVAISLGKGSNVEVLGTIADSSAGLLVEINDSSKIETFYDTLADWLLTRS